MAQYLVVQAPKAKWRQTHVIAVAVVTAESKAAARHEAEKLHGFAPHYAFKALSICEFEPGKVYHY